MFILDTTTVSDYLRGNKGIINRLRKTSFQNIYVTSITEYELEYGLLKKPNLRQAYGGQLDLLYAQINHLDFNLSCALAAARIKQQLINAGTPIGIEDVLIAAIALDHNFAVVTSNLKHFQKIENLEVVNWKR